MTRAGAGGAQARACARGPREEVTARPPCAAALTFPGLCTPAVPGPGPEAAAGLARRFRQERRAGDAGTKAHRPGALPVPAAPCGRGRKAPPGHPPSSSPPHFPAPRRIPGSPLRASRAGQPSSRPPCAMPSVTLCRMGRRRASLTRGCRGRAPPCYAARSSRVPCWSWKVRSQARRLSQDCSPPGRSARTWGPRRVQRARLSQRHWDPAQQQPGDGAARTARTAPSHPSSRGLTVAASPWRP